jgi:prepilin-type N-terminal cleavage/methylation domain-containing protein
MNRIPKIYSAFTLVELVVVLTILGLTASIVTVRFAGPLRRARVEAALEQWQSIDFLARQASQSRNATIALQPAPVAATIFLQQEGRKDRRWPLESTISLRLETINGQPLTRIDFPRSEGTLDYRVIVRDGTFTRSIAIAGGTGSVRRDE